MISLGLFEDGTDIVCLLLCVLDCTQGSACDRGRHRLIATMVVFLRPMHFSTLDFENRLGCPPDPMLRDVWIEA